MLSFFFYLTTKDGHVVDDVLFILTFLLFYMNLFYFCVILWWEFLLFKSDLQLFLLLHFFLLFSLFCIICICDFFLKQRNIQSLYMHTSSKKWEQLIYFNVCVCVCVCVCMYLRFYYMRKREWVCACEKRNFLQRCVQIYIYMYMCFLFRFCPQVWLLRKPQ